MTRKHFTAVATMLKANLDNASTDAERETIARIARNLAATFSQINGSFRFNTFYADCGLLPDGYTAQTWIADATVTR